MVSESWLVPVTRLSQTTGNGEFPIQDAFERKCMCGDANLSFAIPQLFYLYSCGDQLARIPILSTQLTVYNTLDYASPYKVWKEKRRKAEVAGFSFVWTTTSMEISPANSPFFCARRYGCEMC